MQTKPLKSHKAIRCLYQPNQRHQKDIERDKDLIRPALKDIFNKLVLGKSPFPLYLHGIPGGGKTCAALCFLDIIPSPTVYWLMNTLHNTVAKARRGDNWSNTYPTRIIHESEIFKRIREANCVVIDEIGARREISDVHYDCLKKAIDLREGKPLIVIGNPDLDEIEQLYDARIRSRLYAGTIAELTTDRRAEPTLKLKTESDVPF